MNLPDQKVISINEDVVFGDDVTLLNPVNIYGFEIK